MSLLSNVQGISKEAVQKKSEGRSVARCLISCFHCFGSKKKEEGRREGEIERNEKKREREKEKEKA